MFKISPVYHNQNRGIICYSINNKKCFEDRIIIYIIYDIYYKGKLKLQTRIQITQKSKPNYEFKLKKKKKITDTINIV